MYNDPVIMLLYITCEINIGYYKLCIITKQLITGPLKVIINKYNLYYLIIDNYKSHENPYPSASSNIFTLNTSGAK